MRRKISRARASRLATAPGSDDILSFEKLMALKWRLGRPGASDPAAGLE
jgi:hypothetical protein